MKRKPWGTDPDKKLPKTDADLKRALQSPADLLVPAIGWAVAASAFAIGVNRLGLAFEESRLAVVVATGLLFCLLPGLPIFLSAARSPLPDLDEPDRIDRSIGHRWVASLALVTASVGCLFAASQHAMNGYYLLTGMLIFFAASLASLFRKVDHYLSLPKIALVYGVQVALVAKLLGP